MKRAAFILLAIVLVGVMLLTACKPAPAPPPAPAPAPAPAPTPAPTAEVFELRLQSSFSPGSMNFEKIQEGLDLLEEMTDGRLHVKLYGTGAIVRSAEILEALGAGTFELGMSAPAYYSGLDPGFSPFFTIPGLWKDEQQARIWFYEFGGIELLRDAYAEYNVYFLGPKLNGAEPIFSTVPLRTLDDFNGLKVRTIAGMTADLMAELGASAIFIPGGELYSALDTGLVDAGEWITVAEDYSMGLHEVADYILWPSFHCPAGMDEFDINMDTWNKLPNDLKACLLAIVPVLDFKYDFPPAAADFKALSEMKALGLEHCVLSEADMAKVKQIAVEVAEAYKAKSPLADAVITSYMDFLKVIGEL